MQILNKVSLSAICESTNKSIFLDSCKSSEFASNKSSYIDKLKLCSYDIICYGCNHDSNEVFEENVKTLSYIEDRLGIDIPYISIDNGYKYDRINIIEFYGLSKEFIFQCSTTSSIIEAIAFIEFRKLNNAFIGISEAYSDKWCYDRDMFYAIKKYIKCIHSMFDDTNLLTLLEGFGYNNLFVRA
jgi:hypothetical protein